MPRPGERWLNEPSQAIKYAFSLIPMLLALACGPSVGTPPGENDAAAPDRDASSQPDGGHSASDGGSDGEIGPLPEDAGGRPDDGCGAGMERVGAACVDADGCRDVTCGSGLTCVDKPAPELGHTCKNVDACEGAPCGAEVCRDQPPPGDGFLCGDDCSGAGCPDGYACLEQSVPATGRACFDIDGCADVACGAGLRCVDEPAPAEGHHCLEYDACEDSACGPGTQCVDNPAPSETYRCNEINDCEGVDCGEGMECLDPSSPQSGHSCADVDGCYAGNLCGSGMECIDVPAPGDGFTCVDRNDCVGVDCGQGRTCQDRPAPLDGFTCVDNDGCVGAVCEEGSTCFDERAPSEGHGCIDPYDVLYKWLPSAPAYETRVHYAATSIDAELVQAWADEGFVVTAAYRQASAGDSLIAVRPADPALRRQFDTRVVSATEELAIELGNDGYLITAASGNGVLFGTRPRGSKLWFQTKVVHTNGRGIDDWVTALAQQGYFIASARAEDGFDLYAVRPSGSSLKYELRFVQSTDRFNLFDLLGGLAAEGYVLTQATTTSGTTLYHHFSARPAGSVRPYASLVWPSPTEDVVADAGETGYIVTGAGRDGLHYQHIWAIQRPAP